MIRTSSYTIYVDLPGNREELLLVHGYTGTYDVVSRRVATYVRSLEHKRPPKPLYGDWTPEPEIAGAIPEPSQATLSILRQRGYLTEMSLEEEEETFVRIVNHMHDRSLRQPPTYMFMPNYDCNLRCAYCFQDHMRTDSRFRHLLRTMKPDMVDRIILAISQIESSHGTKDDKSTHRSVGFFGGEPLLASSRATVAYIIDKIRENWPSSFWAITNGTEIEAYEDLLSPEKISFLQITLDGPPSSHDSRRIYADGSGSFKKISDNITMALEKSVRVGLRVNVDRENFGSIPELIHIIEDLQWSGSPYFSIGVSPIRATNSHVDAKTTFNSWELDQAVEKLIEECPQARIINTSNDALAQQARKVFSGASVPVFKESHCSAHSRLYIFDALADIYACWDRTGDSSVRIGHIDEDGGAHLETAMNQLWKSRTVASNPACRKCRYALHCGGGCAVLAYGKTGQFHSNHCDGFASSFRSAVAEAFSNRGPETISSLTPDLGC